MVPAMAHALDTGPSAATAAVGACLLVATRMNRCALLLTVGIVTAALITRAHDGDIDRRGSGRGRLCRHRSAEQTSGRFLGATVECATHSRTASSKVDTPSVGGTTHAHRRPLTA
jgi:hypothetical protein